MTRRVNIAALRSGIGLDRPEPPERPVDFDEAMAALSEVERESVLAREQQLLDALADE